MESWVRDCALSGADPSSVIASRCHILPQGEKGRGAASRRLGELGFFEREGGRKEIAAVSSGFVEIHNDRVIVLAETLELSQEIDVDRARRAAIKAQERLQAKESFEADMVKWQRKLQRAQIRQQAAEFLLPPH